MNLLTTDRNNSACIRTNVRVVVYSNYENNTSSSTTNNKQKILNKQTEDSEYSCNAQVPVPSNLQQQFAAKPATLYSGTSLSRQSSTGTEETTGMRDTVQPSVFVRGRSVVFKTTGELTA